MPRYIVTVDHGYRRGEDLTTGRGGVSYADVVDTDTGRTVARFPSTLGVDAYRRLAARHADRRNAQVAA